MAKAARKVKPKNMKPRKAAKGVTRRTKGKNSPRGAKRSGKKAGKGGSGRSDS